MAFMVLKMTELWEEDQDHLGQQELQANQDHLVKKVPMAIMEKKEI